MQASQALLQFIAEFEASGKPHLKAVKSPEQPNPLQPKYEIGFGHNSDNRLYVYPDTVITEGQAWELLEYDVDEAASRVRKAMTAHKLDFNQHEFDALVSAVYNGVDAISTSTGLGRAIIAWGSGVKDALEIERQWGRWVYATVGGRKKRMAGLVRRRYHEVRMFLDGEYKTS